MAILRTDFSDGDTFFAGTTSDTDKLNGITNEVNRKGVIHRKVYESAAQVNVSGSSFTDTAKTFDLAAPINSLITSITYKCELSNNTSNNASITDIKITGTNLGTKYLTGYFSYLPNTNLEFTRSPVISDTAETNGIFYWSGSYGTFNKFGVTSSEPLKILDATTTFTIRLKRGEHAFDALLKNAKIEVIYIENYTED